MLTNKLKLNPDKTKFLLIWNERHWSKYLSMFPIELFSVKTNPAKSARNLGVIFDKISSSAHIYQQSVAHAFTTCMIFGVFDVTLISIVQNYLQLLLCPVVLIIVIHFCMMSLTLISLGFSMLRINWLAWWQSLLHLVAVFHCFVPVIGCQKGLEYCSRWICWLTKPCVNSSPFIFTPCLLYHFHTVPWDQPTIIVCQSLGSRPTQVEQPPAVCPFSHFSFYLQETSEDTSLWLGLFPIDTGMPDGLLMLQNCFFNFAVEHWFGCRGNEPGFGGGIGTIEVWLIDWLIDIKTSYKDFKQK